MVDNSEKKTKTTSLSAIALGSNIGESLEILQGAIESLEKIPGITIKVLSRWYKTVPVGGPEQPDYLNGCAILEVQLTPEQLLKTLQEIEQEFGRVREERWGPRTLDLDLILFNDLILDTPDLEIPHPRMRERAFVLIPLSEIAPDWIEPVTKESISQLVEKVDGSDVRFSGFSPLVKE